MHVIVIGGGIIGLATAYYLSTHDIDVTVCEQHTLGSGSTERANGGIRAQFTTPANIELSKRSLAVWESFPDHFGTSIDFRQHGYLFLTTDDDHAETFKNNVRIQNYHGVPTEFLTRDDVAQYTDLTPTAEIVAGTYSPTDGFADPHLAVQGFADNTVANGATITTNTKVTDVTKTPDGYTVTTSSGPLTGDSVVNAAGPWSPIIASYLDVELPITRIRRQLALITPDQPLRDPHPYTYHTERQVSFRPERNATTIVSGNFPAASTEITDPDSYSTRVDTDFQIAALERLNSFSTYYGPESKPTGGWAGMYTVTPDHNPIIDTPIDGFYIATGFSGHGFMHAPAVGQHLTNLITENTSFLDPHPYRLDRFDTDHPSEQLVL